MYVQSMYMKCITNLILDLAQRSNPLSQIAILKKNGSLDSGIQA
jgi:hypothetical protein